LQLVRTTTTQDFDNCVLQKTTKQIKNKSSVESPEQSWLVNLTRNIEKYPQLAKWETQKEMMEKFTKMECQNGNVPTQLTHFPVQMYYRIY
jgi:hypothetical protein